MNKLYEVEIQRSGISPKQFFSYCRREALRRTGVDVLPIWIDSFEDWTENATGYSCDTYHEDWDEPVHEICRTKPYDYHYFITGAYNFIMEFDFDDDKSGHGYLYAVEYER